MSGPSPESESQVIGAQAPSAPAPVGRPHPKLVRLDNTIAKVEARLAAAKLRGNVPPEGLLRLEGEIRDLMRRRRNVAGGLARGSTRRDEARDARIAAEYPSVAGKKGAVLALAQRENLSTEQVRRIGRPGKRRRLPQLLPPPPVAQESTLDARAPAASAREKLERQVREIRADLGEVRRGLLTAARDDEANHQLFAKTDWMLALAKMLDRASQRLNSLANQILKDEP